MYISSLSKGLGAFGGYIASEKNVIDFCINKSKTFIYTSALPSVLINYAANRFSANREPQRKKLENNVRKIISGLQNLGYEITSNTHIIPIIIGDEKKAMEFGEELMRNKVFAQPIRFPTVSKNEARIRLSVTAWISASQISQILDVFEKVGKRFKML